MISTLKKYIHQHIKSSPVRETAVVEAYDIWSDNYDSQPGNLMLDLDELVLSQLMAGLNLRCKNVADIGCGTGRHWQTLLKQMPSHLTGFDVSPGMLARLKGKFSAADTYTISDNRFADIEDNTYDVIVSTLTVAHIKDLEEAINAWCRILKNKGEIIITDFHPDALAIGGQRTFTHQKKQIAVENYVHPVREIITFFLANGFHLVSMAERKVDESVRHYYTEQNAMHVYEKFKGMPIIYGLHLRRD